MAKDLGNYSEYMNKSRGTSDSIRNVRIKKEKDKVISSTVTSTSKKTFKTSHKFGKFLSSALFEPHTSLSPFAYVFIIFFVLCMTAYIYNDKVLSFSSILNFLGSYESDFSFTSYFGLFSQLLYIEGDWGLFDFLRGFFNMFMSILSLLVRAVGGILDVIKFIGDVFVVLL